MYSALIVALTAIYLQPYLYWCNCSLVNDRTLSSYFSVAQTAASWTQRPNLCQAV